MEEGSEKPISLEAVRASPPRLSALHLHFPASHKVGHSTSESQHMPEDRAGLQPRALRRGT